MSLSLLDSSVDSYSCPPLTDADYLTSSRAASRKPSRKESRSPVIPATGPAFGENGDYKDDKHTIDPRRFTPTLHANLVSEILSLRREVENKNSLVLNLEEHMLQIKEENTTLHGIVSAHSKEKKSLKRHMDALESGTLSAIEDIARERDRANDTLSEIKSQLDRSQKKARRQEEDIKQSQEIWQRDQENWDTERRVLERKIHVVEGRLKTVLAEVATQSISQHRRSIDNSNNSTRERPSSRASGRRSAGSLYRESFSVSTSVGGRTLADELNLDAVSDAESEVYGSPEALPEELDYPRSYSSQSNRQSIKARKLLGLYIDATEDASAAKDSTRSGYPSMSDSHTEQPPTTTYKDTATQYSPPVSPMLSPDQQRLSTITEFDGDSMLDESRIMPLPLDFNRPQSVHMVSSSCQTIETPISPPETPVRSRSESCEIHSTSVTTSTQTSENLFSATMGLMSSIPVIAIHPAKSDDGVVLPPNSRNASTQAHILGEVTSIGVQTDSIRTDERLTRLPAHLHPAIIHPISPAPSPVPSPAPEVQNEKQTNKLTSASSRPRLEIPRKKPAVAKSILRKSVQQAHQDHPDSEEDISDDSFLKRAPVKKVLSRVDNSWQMVTTPIENTENITDTEEIPPQLPDLEFDDFNLKLAKFESGSPRQRITGRPGQTGKMSESKSYQPKDTPIDVKANIGRARSPSEPIIPDKTNGIPYPVPDRSSSRKFPWLVDDMDSPTPKSSKYSKGSRTSKRKQGLRKMRSETGDLRFRSHSRSPSPQPFDIFTDSLANIPPPLPENDITTPLSATFRQHPHAQSTVPSRAESTHSGQTTVVDSIAQTMIGEWMYKYVRRRKSFGLPDEPGTGENSVNGGVRHQRWVWVAPYERAVMWSSKQPTSGTALMGKSGRKLVISSVLDVQDDSPMPKGAPQTSHFGRSILILTPQRALKFTAVSKERHYVWMNALSFLSQGAVDFADILDQPPPLPTSVGTEKSRQGSLVSYRPAQQSTDGGSLHRSRINDSIRIAKGKERPLPAQRTYKNAALVENQQSFPVPEMSSEGAEAPSVPRTTADTRKRSNTASRGQTPSIRNFTSSNKGSLQPLRSRGKEAVPDPPPRSALRLWTGKPQRTVSEDSGLKDASRTPSTQSNSIDIDNTFEAVGTMRMSAFVQEASESHISNSRAPNSKRTQAWGRSVSATDVEPHARRFGKSMASRKHDKHGKHQDGQDHGSEAALPNASTVTGERDPFEGF